VLRCLVMNLGSPLAGCSMKRFLIDFHSVGLVVKSRTDLAEHKRLYAHNNDGFGELLEHDVSFTPLRSALTVSTIAVAHGRQGVMGGREWKPLLPLAYCLLAEPDQEQAAHDAVLNGLFSGKSEPRKPDDWLLVLHKPIRLPSKVSEMALSAGLLAGDLSAHVTLPRQTEGELRRLVNNAGKYMPDFNIAYFRAVAPIQQTVSFLRLA
jgi:hypothetical protein